MQTASGNHTFIADLTDGKNLTGEYYLCADKQQFVTRTRGDNYLRLVLQDKTGSLNGMVWDIPHAVTGSFEKGDVVKINANVNTYKDMLQLTITRLTKADPSEYQMSDFIRTSRESTESLYKKMLYYIYQISDPGLQKLARAFLVEDAEMAEAMKTLPAASKIHHAYQGGLLEHTVSVTTIADGFCKLYPDLDRDLVLTGALLHDIGKTKELQPFPQLDYTDEGRFMGHIVMGAQMVHEAGRRIPELSSHKLMLLEHIILAHHGKREFGSPVVPATLEAMAVHLSDDADAKMKQALESIEYDTTTGDWTQYNLKLETNFYKPSPQDGPSYEA